ncbi:hypothetical protein [Gryllotalpicola koreensis]|uniref:Uncharacterized protein n=1 Tax=Gryllotalpicola koreensis TaxID=993086 RepID=A0ABP7ZZG0_9MICO
MSDHELLPDGYEPAHVFRVVAMPIERGWGVWLRAADDSIIDSFGLGFPPETPFVPDVLDVLGPLLHERYSLAYQGVGAWDQIEDHWSAIVYELTDGRL